MNTYVRTVLNSLCVCAYSPLWKAMSSHKNTLFSVVIHRGQKRQFFFFVWIVWLLSVVEYSRVISLCLYPLVFRHICVIMKSAC